MSCSVSTEIYDILLGQSRPDRNIFPSTKSHSILKWWKDSVTAMGMKPFWAEESDPPTSLYTWPPLLLKFDSSLSKSRLSNQ